MRDESGEIDSEMTKKKTRKTGSTAAAGYIAKARQFAGSMRRSLEEKQWDAAGLGAVHAVISAADALLAAYGGVRSINPDHRTVVRLLEETLGKKAIASARRHIAFVIARKNVIEYEQRRITGKDAAALADHAERFLRFAEKMLGAIG